MSSWRNSYEISVNGQPVTTWDGATWRSGGDFELNGQRYQVRSNAWGNTFSLTDERGMPIASANRVGRRRWTVEAGGQTYHFQRTSIWRNEHELRVGGQRVGAVRQTSAWGGDLVADLPGLPMPVQIFVLGVVITMLNHQIAGAAAAAAS